MPPTFQDIESELSYAYLHAVAAKAQASCQVANRIQDNAGVDALVTIFGPFSGAKYLKEVDLKIQLKATIGPIARKNGHISYSLKEINHYDALRETEAYSTQRIIAVLFLPKDQEEWLSISDRELLIRQCCYWQCLAGAPESKNSTSQTIYLPEKNLLSPENLRGIGEKIATGTKLVYEVP